MNSSGTLKGTLQEEERGCARPKFLGPKFWSDFVARCGEAWGFPAKSAKFCADHGLVVLMPQQTYLLDGAMKAVEQGYTEDDLFRLADFVRLGGVGWRKGAWDHVSRNFQTELTKALDPGWDGKSDPRVKTGLSRAPPALPDRYLADARRTDAQASDGEYIDRQLDEIEAEGRGKGRKEP